MNFRITFSSDRSDPLFSRRSRVERTRALDKALQMQNLTGIRKHEQFVGFHSPSFSSRKFSLRGHYPSVDLCRIRFTTRHDGFSVEFLRLVPSPLPRRITTVGHPNRNLQASSFLSLFLSPPLFSSSSPETSPALSYVLWCVRLDLCIPL